MDWGLLKKKYFESGIKKVMSFPIDDRTQESYITGLFDCTQHLNDLIDEQGETVFIHDNSGVSRAPTLVVSYFCMFLKLRTMDNLPEAERLLKQYHHMSTPNTAVIKALMQKHKAFVNKQKQFHMDIDNSSDDES